jgi:hypothetical protein
MMNAAHGYCSKQSNTAAGKHGGRLPVPCFARPSADGRTLQACNTKASADGRALQAYGTKASADGWGLQACGTNASAVCWALQACGTKASADGRLLRVCNRATGDISGKHPHRTVIANAVKQSMPHRWIASPFGLAMTCSVFPLLRGETKKQSIHITCCLSAAAITGYCGKPLPVFNSQHSA